METEVINGKSMNSQPEVDTRKEGDDWWSDITSIYTRSKTEPAWSTVRQMNR